MLDPKAVLGFFQIAAVSVWSFSLQAVELSWERHTIDNQSRGADGARMADVNGDGLLDLVTPWEEGGVIRVCLHPGSKKLRSAWPSVTVGEVASPEDAVLVDLDSDGRMDVVSSCEGKLKTMFVHWAPSDPADYLKASDWETEPIPVTAGTQAWMFALPVQIDQRNGIDLVVSSKGAGASVGWLQAPENPRDLSSWQYHQLIDAGWVMSLIQADMNDDGFADILLSDRRGEGRGIKWLEHPGGSTEFKKSGWNVHELGGQNHEVMFIDYADLDGDGVKDVVAATHQREILVLTNSSDSSNWKSAILPAPYQLLKGKSVRIGDVDLDGVMDLVHSTEPNSGPRQPGVTWLKRFADPRLPPRVHPVSDLRGIKFDLLQLIDLDQDGDLDVITCEERDNLGLVWFENPRR